MRHFNNELRAYRVLGSIHSNSVARFLGHFEVEFRERELKEDRVCKVLMLEMLNAQRITRMKATNLPHPQRLDIRNKIIDIVKSLYQNKIYFPTVSLDHFLIVKEDLSPRIYGLGVTFDPTEFPLNSHEEDEYTKAGISMIEVALDGLGFN